MKKFMIITLSAALFAACSSEDGECIDEPKDQPVEIKVSAGIFDIVTRAPVNTGDAITAKFVATTTTGIYTTNLWSATGGFSASETATAAFSFTPPQYYPVDGSTVYIKGYYPSGSLNNNIVTYTETDGSNDVMITAEASGSKTTTGALGFTFSHLLAQLQFTFIAGAGYPVSGKTVTSIIIKNQQTPATLDINNSGILTYNTGNVTLNGTFAISASPGTPVAIHPMFKSGATNVIMDITTNDNVTYTNITAPVATETGKAHMITLTFTPKGITATAIVTAWATGGTGTSNIQ